MKHRLSIAAALVAASSLTASAAFVQLHPPSRETDMSTPQNNTKLMPNAPVGSEYPSHGNTQAGELNLNPSDPRAQLVNGLPNNAATGTDRRSRAARQTCRRKTEVKRRI